MWGASAVNSGKLFPEECSWYTFFMQLRSKLIGAMAVLIAVLPTAREKARKVSRGVMIKGVEIAMKLPWQAQGAWFNGPRAAAASAVGGSLAPAPRLGSPGRPRSGLGRAAASSARCRCTLGGALRLMVQEAASAHHFACR